MVYELPKERKILPAHGPGKRKAHGQAGGSLCFCFGPESGDWPVQETKMKSVAEIPSTLL
ncbi:MAG: hypothetical protein GDA53_09510 [Rhodobacteraceae bacterium]|nr:hypothetical protein [Paracoccaceae bacterium]